MNYITNNYDDYQILSACGPYAPEEVRKQKRIWLRKNFPILSSNPIFVNSAEDKAKYSTPYSILIDDMDTAIEPFNKGQGTAILHTSTEKTIKELQKIKMRLKNILNEIRT